jgi:adenylate cyclase
LNNIVVLGDQNSGERWPIPVAGLHSLGIFRESAQGAGFTNVNADSDGVLRRVPLLMRDERGFYPSLALAALHTAHGKPRLRLKQSQHDALLRWGDSSIPLDEQGRLLLNYPQQEMAFKYYPAADVLKGEFQDGAFNGKVVFVGAWASGLGDRHATPYNKSTPGLEVHAVIASNLLTGSFLQQPYWTRGAELLFVLVLGVASSLLIARFGFLTNLFMLLVVTLLPLVGTLAVFRVSGVYIPPALPLLLLFINSSVLGVLSYGIETYKVHRRTLDLVDAQDTAIMGMVSLSAVRDEETGGHILRTQHYVRTLARQLRELDMYEEKLDEEDIELLFLSAPLHDIGKVGIPDRILRKPGKLTEEEYEIMKTHPVLGENALAAAVSQTKSREDSGYLEYARDVILAHHEKWDGSGYPSGLRGLDIPLAGRLMALADVYDAMISERVYKPAIAHGDASRMIVAERGKHFDPDVVDAFIATEEQFKMIAARYQEDVPPQGLS